MEEASRSKTWLFGASGLLLIGLVASVMFWYQPAVGQAMSPLDVTVTKTASASSIAPGQLLSYTVIFSNSSMADIALNTITDTLPAGFEFGGMDPSGDWMTAPIGAPTLVWQGPITIPATSTLSLVYNVTASVPSSATPYANAVTAVSSGTIIGPATAGVLVQAANLTVTKEAWPTQLLSGETVTYTVVFSNSGHLTGTLTLITDTLDAPLTFLGMTAGSDVLTQPQGITGTLVWTGPFDVPPLGSLTLRYEAHVSSPPGLVGNRVEATAESVLVGPAEAQVTVKPWQVFLPIVSKDFKPAYFTINKTANPETFKVGSGTNVVYTVIIRNEGDTSGTLATIYDTLPDGFVFLSMLGGSGITTSPNGTMGTITWAGPFTVSAHSQTQLIYMVSPKDVVGNYSNAVNVTAQVGTPPSGPATATVTIEPDIDYLLYDTFDTDANQWTPFTKYWRTTPEQWYWEDNVGIQGGAYNHNRELGIIKPGGEAEDALTMYLGPGSENWTNYRFEAWVYPASIGGEDVDKAGLWFRGLYDGNYGGSTQAVLAYYFYLSPGETQVNAEIWQTQTPNDCEGETCTNPEWQYAFNNPRRLAKERWGMLTANWFNRWHKIAVEVRGNNIKGYVDDQLAINFTDTEGDILLRGSVGLACYKAPLLRYDNVLVTPLP